MSPDTAFCDATELSERLRSRTLSSVDLLDLYLARIEEHDPALGAVVTRDIEGARTKALEADRRLAAGEPGELLGLPVTIKDAWEVAGLRTTAGAPILRDHVPQQSATAVARLQAAGAIVFGKTNVPPFSGDVQTDNQIFGRTQNPWDLGRTPGGSSGGAAVAVACGFTAFELGSDIGGSIRTPANWTGVYGHKTSWGIVPGRGHIPGPPGTLSTADLGVFGPLARSARDLDKLLLIVAGPDDLAATAWKFSLPTPRATDLRGFRIAALFDDPHCPVDPEVRERLETVAEFLQKAGARVDRTARPFDSLEEIVELYSLMLAPIMASGLPPASIEALEEWAAAEAPYDPRMRFARGAVQSHRTWLSRHEQRVRLQHRMRAFFSDYDVFLSPVVPVAAIAHDDHPDFYGRQIRVGDGSRPYSDLLSWIAPATLAGLPATSAPVGRTTEGLPIGLQIVGPPLEDRTPIAFAAALAARIGGFEPPTRVR